MGIEARMKTRPADWVQSFVRVSPVRKRGRLLVRVDLARRVSVELRFSHALRLADALVDTVESVGHEHEENT